MVDGDGWIGDHFCRSFIHQGGHGHGAATGCEASRGWARWGLAGAAKRLQDVAGVRPRRRLLVVHVGGRPTGRRTGGPCRGRSRSARSRTGSRWTIFTKLPVAFCGGSRDSVWPVPMVKPVIRPSYSLRPPYMSTSQRTRWPMRRSASCVSLKLASIQISVSERTAIRACPGGDVVAGVDIPAGHDAVDLARDVAVAEVQLRLGEVAPGLEELALGLPDRRRLGHEPFQDPIDVPLPVAADELVEGLLGRPVHGGRG